MFTKHLSTDAFPNNLHAIWQIPIMQAGRSFFGAELFCMNLLTWNADESFLMPALCFGYEAKDDIYLKSGHYT